MNDLDDSPVTPETSSDVKTDKKDFLVIGLGASAGGIKALKEFFAEMPADSGMAFVVILHLSPDHESNLDQILQHQTPIKVEQVTEIIKVRPNEVYVIPPNKNLAMADGVIKLTEPEPRRGAHVAIDLFFRSLADAYGKNGVCVVLSGTGSDGTLGLKRVKEADGFAIVQDPEDAEYDQMPRSAMATNLVDWILPVSEMPRKLLSFQTSSERLNLNTGNAKAPVKIKGAEDLSEILNILRVRTGHDFSNYKQPTLLRRVARHLQIHELEDIRAYLTLLRTRPDEIQSLLKNLLINVTNFFRDKDAFEALEKEVIPQLFAGKTGKDAVRVWIAACASGEEAFSLAMLLSEYAAALSDPPKLQIFASDVDDDAISEAREHRYPETIEADVSPERLKKFFVKEADFYRVKKDLRELILFAPHNILRDPPFSKLDLISCRNLLIYLNREAQTAFSQIFHFALNKDGFLFLGNSESAETDAKLFAPVDKKHRIYSRRAVQSPIPAAPVLPLAVKRQIKITGSPPVTREPLISFGEIHYKLVEQYAPPSVLVNEEFEIVHLSESAGRFLRLPGGDTTSNLFKLVHPDLLPDLRAALFAAQREGRTAEFQNIRVELDHQTIYVNLVVRQVEINETAQGFLLVIFDEIASRASAVKTGEMSEQPQQTIAGDDAMESVVRRLEEDLRRAKENLQTTIEQSDTTTEELKSSNEEMQAVNEELRSTAEELETGKEELQSVNEELTTVNHEYKDKIDEISRLNSDLQNFLTATDIGTIFLDRDLNIKRYTPGIERIFNIIETDIGRPLAHLTHHLADENLMTDAGEVLRSLKSFEGEMCDRQGRCWLVRILPYRTTDDRIEGVVLTFVDFTELKRATDSLRERDATIKMAQRAAGAGVWNIRVASGEAWWSEECGELYGLKSDSIAMNFETWLTKFHHGERERVEALILQAVKENKDFSFEFRVNHPTRGTRWLWEIGKAELETDGKSPQMAGITIDITDRKKAEESLRESEEQLLTLVDTIPQLAWMSEPDGNIFWYNRRWYEYTGTTSDAMKGWGWQAVHDAEMLPNVVERWKNSIATGEIFEMEFPLRGADGEFHWFLTRVSPLRDAAGRIVRWFGTNTDIQRQKEAETALQEANRRKDEFLATLAHELRNPLAPIQSGLEIIRRATDDKQARMEAWSVIERQTGQIAHLVDDLLDVSRITQGKINLKKELIELKTPIEMALETSKSLIDAGEHELEVSLPAEPIYLEADMTRVSQIVLNILINSAKYTAPGGKINLTATRENGNAVIKIKDTGMGIPPEMLLHIFEMFTQVDNIAELTRAGLGIGLSVVKQLVEMHGGTVAAFSEGEGKGSEFVVKLPVAEEQTPASKPEKNDENQPQPRARARRILVVDDNADAAELLEVLLTMNKHEVRKAFDGKTALAAALEFEPEICILDIGLPILDGYELARLLREKMPEVLLVALSGWGQEEDRRRSKEAGFDHHFVKPLEFEKIEELLKAETRTQ